MGMEKYEPTAEDMQKAEEMMTDEQKSMSEEREIEQKEKEQALSDFVRYFWGVFDKGHTTDKIIPQYYPAVAVSPSSTEYIEFLKDKDKLPERYGEYTINSDIPNDNFDKLFAPDKIKMVLTEEEELRNFRREFDTFGKQVENIIQNYGDEYYFPDIRFLKYIVEEFPNGMEDSDMGDGYGSRLFALGSLLRTDKGGWEVPSAYFGHTILGYRNHNFWDRPQRTPVTTENKWRFEHSYHFSDELRNIVLVKK